MENCHSHQRGLEPNSPVPSNNVWKEIGACRRLNEWYPSHQSCCYLRDPWSIGVELIC